MIRPELRRGLKIWAEPVVWLLLSLGLFWILIHNVRASPFFLGGMGLLALGATIGLLNAVSRARMRADAIGTGIVLVDEGRVGHFGPDRGGFVEIDALRKVTVLGPKGARFWHLEHEDGAAVQVPQSARDADQLIDFLVTLDGVTPGKLSRALSSDRDEIVWEMD